MAWVSPFSLPGSWFKGNLHMHTTQSDGEATVEQALTYYRQRGYDFVAVTDHWVYTPGRNGAAGDGAGLLTISGGELHGPGYHMLAVGLRGLPNQALENDPLALAQAVRDLGGLPFFAHPYWVGQTSAEIAACPAIAGVEVFNSVCDKMDGLGYSYVQWDEALKRGQRLLGLAVDDTHWRYGEEGRGFVMVRAAKLDEAHLLDALRRGAFYASTGPTLMDLSVIPHEEGRALMVRCSPCRAITFHASGPRGHRFEAPAGQWLDTATWPFKEEGVYLRVECEDAQGGTAWSNPVFADEV